MKKALFVLLDDVLVRTLSGNKYSLHSEDWTFIQPTLDAIKAEYTKDHIIFLIANQKQLKNNKIGEKMFRLKIDRILTTLEKDLNVKNNTICYAYSDDEEDIYNYLPNPGLIYNFLIDYELAIPNSTLIGTGNLGKDIVSRSGISKYIDVFNLNLDINEVTTF